jgi:hypothetical protein
LAKQARPLLKMHGDRMPRLFLDLPDFFLIPRACLSDAEGTAQWSVGKAIKDISGTAKSGRADPT